MKTLVCIMVHQQAQETFNRHLPLYEAHGCDIVTYSPVDAPVNPNGHLGLLFGRRSHHDAEANRRFKRLISFLTTTAYDDVWIHEYDSLCLSPYLPTFCFKGCGESNTRLCPVLAANCFYDDGKRFQGRLFTHPPIYANQRALQVLDASLKKLPDDVNGGFWDRMCGLAIENAGIEPLDFMKHGLGYAENTIPEGNDLAALRAAANGAIFFHGVKSPHVLAGLIHGHKQAQEYGKLRHGLEIPI